MQYISFHKKSVRPVQCTWSDGPFSCIYLYVNAHAKTVLGYSVRPPAAASAEFHQKAAPAALPAGRLDWSVQIQRSSAHLWRLRTLFPPPHTFFESTPEHNGRFPAAFSNNNRHKYWRKSTSALPVCNLQKDDLSETGTQSRIGVQKPFHFFRISSNNHN